MLQPDSAVDTAAESGCVDAPKPSTFAAASWQPAPVLAKGSDRIRQIQAQADEASGDVMVRIETVGDVVPNVYLDVDGDRLNGAWTFQTHVAASAWNIMIDDAGNMWRHIGRSDEWLWEPIATGDGYWWQQHDGNVEMCLPAAVLLANGGDRTRVHIAAAIGDDEWLPHPFLAGAALTPRAVTQRTDSMPLQPPSRLAFAYQWAPWEPGDCAAQTDPLGCAARRYAQFGHVVFAAGLEDPDHPSHAQTAALINAVRALQPEIEIWGYVSLLRHQGALHDTADVARRASRWANMGVTGVFLDEFDLCEAGWRHCRRDRDENEIIVTRARQTETVTAIHAYGLAVFANGHSLHGVLGDVRGVPTPLGDGDGVRPADMYLLENPTVWDSRWWGGLDRLAAIARFNDTPQYAARAGVRLAVVDTTDGPASVAPDRLFAASWWRAVLAGADAHGFTNSTYSATDELANDLFVPGLPERSAALFADRLTYASPVMLADDGMQAYRYVADCDGQIVGRVLVTVGGDGAVRGGFLASEAPASCS